MPLKEEGLEQKNLPTQLECSFQLPPSKGYFLWSHSKGVVKRVQEPKKLEQSLYPTLAIKYVIYKRSSIMHLSMGVKPLTQEKRIYHKHMHAIYLPTQSQNKGLKNERFNQLADLSKCCQTTVLINIFFH